MFTVIIVVCSLKSMYAPSFIVIGYCVSELHGPIVKYCLRLFIVVLHELHCLPNYLHICIIKVRDCYHITEFGCSIPYGF